MGQSYEGIRRALESVGQEHVLRLWDELDSSRRDALLDQIAALDVSLANRLIEEWILDSKEPARFDRIDPVDVVSADGEAAREAVTAGEEALHAGRVGLLLVAGGQGTRLGFDGPKGAYRVGPLTGRSIFAYQADKIHNVQARYGCRLPWYIMVGASNELETRRYFEANDYFGLRPQDVLFFSQRMMPCVSENGKWLLEAPDRLATNPNGHGGCIPAAVECGITEDARNRGIDTLSYFQVDNWAVRLADPKFIGLHVSQNAEIGSKICPKVEPREPVGVHCVCDGVYQVIEYTELDLYPQLLETDAEGNLIHYAGNTAIHVFDVGFIERVARDFHRFPWHCSHKKVPYLDESGTLIEPEEPNAYKFETFVFDALQFVERKPVVLEIERRGEYTPIKQFSGANSVVEARNAMNEYWASWIEAGGGSVPRDADGHVAVDIEINPRFALTQEEFLAKTGGEPLHAISDLVIDADGKVKLSAPAK